MKRIILVSGPQFEKEKLFWLVTIMDPETKDRFVFWKRPNYRKAMNKAYDLAARFGLVIELKTLDA